MGIIQSEGYFGLNASGLSDEAKAWASLVNDGSSVSATPETRSTTADLLNPRSMASLVKAAEDELRRRKMRGRFLPATLFGEGAWSMLLDLFVSEHRGRKVSITSACIAADVPATTALRWLDVLEGEGLVERQSAVNDKRVKYVSLTDQARRSLCDLLSRQATDRR